MTPSNSLFLASTTIAALARGCAAAIWGSRHPVAKTRSCLSLTFRIEGGEPAGTSIRPGEDGCFTTSIKMRSTTIVGNRSTNPSGIEIEELPFNRIRRRSIDSSGRTLDFSFQSSLEDMLGDPGNCFHRLWAKPMTFEGFLLIWVVARCSLSVRRWCKTSEAQRSWSVAEAQKVVQIRRICYRTVFVRITSDLGATATSQQTSSQRE